MLRNLNELLVSSRHAYSYKARLIRIFNINPKKKKKRLFADFIALLV